jgi:hypothetical protein
MDKAQIVATLERIDVWLLVFGIIVVIGVGGESIFGIRHWWNSRKLQTIQENEERKREETVASLKEKTAIAEERAGSFQLQIAQANERAANAELELAKLKAPRVLTETQQRELIGKLKAFPGTVIAIDFEYADGEAKTLAMQLFVVLGKAGWKPSIAPRSSAMSAASTIGIVVNTFGELKRAGVPIPHRFAPAAEALSSALKEMGLLSTYPGINKVSDNPDESVLMVVGRKPLQ